ncbi:hypothetical protein NXF42_10865, partial [Klebsiella pneumoniae]
KACVLPENPASYRVVRTKSYLFNKASLWAKGVLDIAWRLAECEPFRMPTTVSCASCNRAHVFLLTTTLFDIALWLVIRKKSVCGE